MARLMMGEGQSTKNTKGTKKHKFRDAYFRAFRVFRGQCVTMNIIATSVLLALSLCLPGPAQATEKRIALVIGNDSYRNFAPLYNARADARAVAGKLKSLGFEVTLQLDADAKTALRAVRQFKSQINGGDEAVFYFSGHGVQLDAANYLLPVDIVAENIDQVKDDGLALQRVLDDLREQKARFSLAIIDACRDNPFKGTGKAIGSRGLAPTTAATGQMVLYSAGSGQQALDRLDGNDRDPNGVFTRVLLKEIDKPGLPVDRVLRTVRDTVVRLAQSVGHEQVPALYDQTVGDFYFVRQSAPVEAPAPKTVTEPRPGQTLRDCVECPEMVVIPGGSFDMGSPSYDPAGRAVEGPQHRVTLASYAIAKTEVTRSQFAAFIQATGYKTTNTCITSESRGSFQGTTSRDWRSPGYSQDDHHPAVCLGKWEVKIYLEWLSKHTGKSYRLPSEAEWEYAARGATEQPRYWGANPDQACAYANVRDQITQNQLPESREDAHNCSDAYAYTAPVASFKPNPFGLYDMLGNVSEWVEDCWYEDYHGAPSDGSARACPKSPFGVVRGGSWNDSPAAIRSAHRSQVFLLNYEDVGFRPVRVLP